MAPILTPLRCAAVALVFFLHAGVRARAEVPARTDYQLGDTATEDITTPFPLIVIDPQRTEALRRSEAQRIPPFFRFAAGVSNEVEAALHAAFADNRARFLDAIEAKFSKRKLNAAALANQRFTRLLNSFQRQPKGFPLTTNLARLWALGDSGAVIETNLVTSLRQTTARVIRPDALPGGEKLSTPQVRLLAATSTPADLAAAEKQSRGFPKTNFITLSKARQELEKSFAPEEKAVAKFLAGFVRANCFLDEDLTRQARARKTNDLWAADHFEPGQIIVARGAVVDARARLALDELRTKSVAVTAVAAVAQAEEAQLETKTVTRQFTEQITIATAKAEAVRRQNRWLWGGLAAASLGGAGLWWWLRRRVRSVGFGALVPVRADADSPSDWRQRALAAEQRASQATTLLRAGLLPHLARWLSLELIQRLLFQRAKLLTSHQQAELEVAQLEERLLRLHAPLHERLQAYEQRIAELERVLATRTEENRELIQAAIASTRQKLETERAKQPLAWN